MQAQAASQLNRGVPTDNELHVLPVQGNVSMIVGDGGNIAMSVGNDGVLLVDSGLPENVDKLVALVRQVAPDKPIRLIINTNADKDHAFGNEKLGPMGRRIAGGNEGAGAGLGAQIIGHENVLDRLSAPVGQTSPMTPAGWPTDTYYTKKMEVYVNGESIIIENQPAAHTDGDSMVWFRKSDVVAAGDIYSTTTLPVIDLDAWRDRQRPDCRAESPARHHRPAGKAGRRHVRDSRTRPSLGRSGRRRVSRHGDHPPRSVRRSRSRRARPCSSSRT